jgi:hypothetical protein
MEAFLGVPIRHGGRTLGTLYLADGADGRPFTDRDEQVVVSLAATAAIDDGSGFGAPSRASGVANLRRRSEGRNGTLTIGDRSSGGTSLHWTAPPWRRAAPETGGHPLAVGSRDDAVPSPSRRPETRPSSITT